MLFLHLAVVISVVSCAPIDFDSGARDADWFAADQPALPDLGGATTPLTTLDSEVGAGQSRRTAGPDRRKDFGSASTIKWLQRFGYLGSQGGSSPNASESLIRGEAVVEALQELQNFAGLPPTGVVDEATVEIMMSPRCGNVDMSRTNRRLKRFVLGSEGWNKRRLTVSLSNWNSRLGPVYTREKLMQAFEVWSPYANLNFSFADRPDADIVVAFGRGYHGDNYPFDGAGSILAHAYYPFESGHYGGDVHFDDDENWRLPERDEGGTETHNGGPVVDFFEVAVHEIGHSLGLAHSNDKGSVMYPFYRTGFDSTHLGYSDILALYHLYIARRLEEDYATPATAGTPTTAADDDDDRRRTPSLPTDGVGGAVPATTTPTPTVTRPHYEGDGGSRTAGPAFDTPPSTPASAATDEFDTSPEGNPGDGATRTEVPRTPSFGEAPIYEGDYETVEEHIEHSKGDFAGPGRRHMTMKNVPGTRPTTKLPPSQPRLPASGGEENSDADRRPDLCDGNVDDFVNLRGELFAFKRNYLWRFGIPNQIVPQYPVEIKVMFQDLPRDLTRIDAVYEESTTGTIVIISGRKFWRYDGASTVGPYPIHRLGLPEEVTSVDAAFVWPKNSATYFFSGRSYWKLDETSHRVAAGYPRPISKWRGIPDDLDAVFAWHGRTYFVKGKKFWRFDDDVVHVEPEYPKSFPGAWLGCGADNNVPSTPDLP